MRFSCAAPPGSTAHTRNAASLNPFVTQLNLKTPFEKRFVYNNPIRISPIGCCMYLLYQAISAVDLFAAPVSVETDIVGRHSRQDLPSQVQNIDRTKGTVQNYAIRAEQHGIGHGRLPFWIERRL
jgi:hypothetical protein